ncbi:DMT family transporter [Cupriavidus agavae]|uniref:Drug/metabolite transporter (DMT)-like permease n=1 Tax=Cupriavidus agavae TaxID=1001822 RepID=A0A4Q7S706_9BURK|nr:DMT family transporter [Cupriavidus agavae]RZT42125.1 drug/metabolite transporter (DMT)-like permease [Cupriavidus agavae]
MELAKQRGKAWLIMAIPPLLWAGNFIVGRAVRDDIPPMTLAFIRHLLAFACLLPFAIAAMRRDRARYWPLRWRLCRTSLSGLAGFNLFVYVGLHHTSASNALLLNSTIPMLIVLLGAAVYRQRLKMNQAFGMVLSGLGVCIIIAHGELSRLVTLQFSEGDLLVFLGMISFALYTLWLRDFPADMNRIGLMAIQLLIAAVALLPFALWEYKTGAHIEWHGTTVAAVAYVAIVASVAANILYFSGVAKIGAARAGIFIHLIPAYGVALSVAFLGEHLKGFHIFGLAAILAGLSVSSLRAPISPGRRHPTA